MMKQPLDRRRHGWLSVVVALASLLVAGCRAADPLPTYEWAGPGHAVEVLAERARRVDGVAARCTITVDAPERGPVSIDGLLVAQKPGQMRLQTWKFDQQVFDLVLRGEEVWLWTSEEAKDVDRHLPEGPNTGLWLNPLMVPLDPAAAKIVEDDAGAGRLTLRWPLAALQAERPAGAIDADTIGWSLLVEIDRPTLTIREMRVLDAARQTVQTVRLERYRLVQQLPWPTRLIASGKFDMQLRMDDVELNPDLPATAFVPRADARKR